MQRNARVRERHTLLPFGNPADYLKMLYVLRSGFEPLSPPGGDVLPDCTNEATLRPRVRPFTTCPGRLVPGVFLHALNAGSRASCRNRTGDPKALPTELTKRPYPLKGTLLADPHHENRPTSSSVLHPVPIQDFGVRRSARLPAETSGMQEHQILVQDAWPGASSQTCRLNASPRKVCAAQYGGQEA